VYLRAKPIDTIDESDLQRLVDAGAQETETADFKEEMWGNADEDKREMLRDITSFANQRGGEIYIGIRDDDGTTIEIAGVEGKGLAERIQSSCDANIERTLRGLQIRPVPLENGRSVLVVRVPYSLSGPHVVTFKGLNQFWIRHGRQKVPMTVDEIEATYVRRFEAETRLERFIEERKQRAWNESKGDVWVFLSMTPLFFREEVVDSRDPQIQQLLRRPPEHRDYRYDVIGCLEAHPSLLGLSAEVEDGRRVVRRLELHRNGHLEFAERTCHLSSSPPREEQLGVASKLVALQTYSFVNLGRSILAHSRITTPVAVSLAILNSRSTYLITEPGPGLRTPRVEFNEDRLDIPLMYSQDIGTEGGGIVKRLNDTLWNAYRLPRCPYVTDDGDLTGIR
jgi:hypothetical protein